MKRDLGLIYEILESIEQSDHDPREWIHPRELASGDYSVEQISYQVELLDDADFVVGWDLSGGDSYEVAAKRLTMTGHEFLDAARSKDVWEKMLAAAKEKSLPMTLEVGQTILQAFAKKKLGLD